MDIETINVDNMTNDEEHLIGIDLLMNKSTDDDDNKSVETNKPDISLGDLSNIQIVQPDEPESPKTISINIGPPEETPLSLPETLPETVQEPINNSVPTFRFDKLPEKPPEELPQINNVLPTTYVSEPKPEITYFDRYSILEKIRKAEKKGKVFSKNYTIESNYDEMESEYKAYVAQDSKNKSCKFQGTILTGFVGFLESMNKRFDPLDINLDGWKDQVSENISDYDDIFAALHDKYASNGEKWPPEIELIIQLCGSAMLLSMTNAMFKNSMPDLGDVIKSNPELAKNFMDATAQQMKQTSPGFSNFIQSTLKQTPPPPPMDTQRPSQQQAFQPHVSPPPTYRPDLEKSKMSEGISISRQNAPVSETKRPEMNGPADISSLLSGIKQKPIKTPINQSPINQPPQVDPRPPPQLNSVLPKKTKRRGKSDRNTVSLDL